MHIFLITLLFIDHQLFAVYFGSAKKINLKVAPANFQNQAKQIDEIITFAAE